MSAAVQPGRTALVMVESPTNPRMQVCKISKFGGDAFLNSYQIDTFTASLAVLWQLSSG